MASRQVVAAAVRGGLTVQAVFWLEPTGLARFYYARLRWIHAISRGKDMNSEAISRRLFLQSGGAVASSSVIRAALPALAAAAQAACTAKEQGATFETLSAAEAREVIAIAARILPTTDTPGATEAGVVYFVDKALGSFLQGSVEMARGLLADFQSGIKDAYAGASRFSDLDAADQDAYLKAHENSQFFFGIRFLTVAGVFGMSHWGGNRDDIGWKLVGMDGPPHAWAPPFGYYDAEIREQDNAE